MENSIQTGGVDEVAAGNKELVRDFYRQVFVNWDLTVVEQVIHPQFRSHDWAADSASAPQGFLDFYAGVRAAFPDTHYEVDDLIAEGNRVVVRWRLLGTHQGEFYGIPPTGYWEWFRKDSTLMRSGTFRHGIQIGKWTTYDKSGQVYKMTDMKEGKKGVKGTVIDQD